jgi:hypothetical protein
MVYYGKIARTRTGGDDDYRHYRASVPSRIPTTARTRPQTEVLNA